MTYTISQFFFGFYLAFDFLPVIQAKNLATCILREPDGQLDRICMLNIQIAQDEAIPTDMV